MVEVALELHLATGLAPGHAGCVDLGVVAGQGEFGLPRRIGVVVGAEDSAERLGKIDCRIGCTDGTVARHLEGVGVLDAHTGLLPLGGLVGRADVDRPVARDGLVRHHEGCARETPQILGKLLRRIADAVGIAAMGHDDRLRASATGEDKGLGRGLNGHGGQGGKKK